MADRLTELIKDTLIYNGLGVGRVELEEDGGRHIVEHGTVHSWACQWPDRYGECDCIDELAAELVATFRRYRRELPVMARATQEEGSE